MLYDLWNQRSVWDVANEYEVPRGIVQNLMTSAAAFSFCVLRFCEVRTCSIHRAVIIEITLAGDVIGAEVTQLVKQQGYGLNNSRIMRRGRRLLSCPNHSDWLWGTLRLLFTYLLRIYLTNIDVNRTVVKCNIYYKVFLFIQLMHNYIALKEC